MPAPAHGTINRELALLKLAFSLAIKARRLLFKPHIEMLEEKNARQGFLDPATFEQVCRRIKSPAVRAVLRFAYVTGWRKNEVLKLTWGRVNFDEGIVELDAGTTKSGAGRRFAFGEHPELAALMREQRAETDRVQRAQDRIIPWVFHRHGKPIANYYKAWHTACRAAGCPGRVPHDMRRSSVRNLVRAGVSENTAMLVSGHKTRAVFDRYDIQSDADIREAARRLGGAKGTEKGQSGTKAAG
jgi:integrase